MAFLVCDGSCAPPTWDHMTVQLTLGAVMWAALAVGGLLMALSAKCAGRRGRLAASRDRLEDWRRAQDESFAYSTFRLGVTLLHCVLFGMRTYSGNMTDAGYLLEVLACLVRFPGFAAVYGASQLRGVKHGLRFVVLSAPADVFLVGSLAAVPLAAQGTKTWLSLSFLAALRLLELWAAWLYSMRANLKVQRMQMIDCSVRTAIAVFLVACAMLTFERLGDPDSLTVLAEEEWNLVSSCYYVISTVTTVGYRNMAPETALGRLGATLVTLAGVSFGLVAYTRVNQVVELQLSGGGSWSKSSWKEKSIIVAGNATADVAISFILEVLHKDHAEDSEDLHIVLLLPPRSGVAEAVLKFLDRKSNRQFRDRVHVLQGSVLEDADMNRVCLAEADCCILLPNVRGTNPVQEDTESIIRCMSVRRFAPHVRVIILLLKAESEPLIEVGNTASVGDDNTTCVVLDRIKLGLVGKSCEVTGFAAMICNLVKCEGRESDDAVENWRKEYERGLANEIYEVPLSSEYADREALFQQVVMDVLERSNGEVYLIGLVESTPDESASRVLMNPGARYPIMPTYRISTCGIFIAQDREAIAQCESEDDELLCGVYPPNSTLRRWVDIKPNIKGKTVFGTDIMARNLPGVSQRIRRPSISSVATHATHASGAHSMATRSSGYRSGEYASELGDDDDEDGDDDDVAEEPIGGAPDLPEEDLELRLIGGLKGEQRKKLRQVAALVKQKQRAMYPLRPALKTLAKGGHVVFTFSMSTKTKDVRLGVEHFVRPLRQGQKHLQVPIVVLAPIFPSDWESVSRMPEVYYMKGSPLSTFDLERANMRCARAVFICNMQKMQEGSVEAWRIDSDTVCAGRLIESMLPPDSETVVLAELAVGSNHEFLPIRQNTGMSQMRAEGSRRSVRAMTLLEGLGASEDGFRARLQRGCAWASDAVRDGLVHMMGGGALDLSSSPSNKAKKSPAESDEGDDGDQDEAAEYSRHPRYASGQLFVADIVTSLVANTFYNRSLIDLVSTMVSANVEMRPVPDKWIGKTFREYFDFLLWDENRFGLAIIRRARESRGDRAAKRQIGLATSAKNESDIKQETKVANRAGETIRRFVFVYTAPHAKETILLESDRIICFGQARLE